MLAHLVERLIRIQEAERSKPSHSKFLLLFLYDCDRIIWLYASWRGLFNVRIYLSEGMIAVIRNTHHLMYRKVSWLKRKSSTTIMRMKKLKWNLNVSKPNIVVWMKKLLKFLLKVFMIWIKGLDFLRVRILVPNNC